ncbi:unnamed protein product [Aphis gossypii]|uniref:Uncharacterized protein n=1 Tax=Aphis gossypii TaxID=80765 RepID=A0A9P0JA13_APHGO|nr:unnamed protein product [Aphis gossypii]
MILHDGAANRTNDTRPETRRRGRGGGTAGRARIQPPLSVRPFLFPSNLAILKIFASSSARRACVEKKIRRVRACARKFFGFFSPSSSDNFLARSGVSALSPRVPRTSRLPIYEHVSFSSSYTAVSQCTYSLSTAVAGCVRSRFSFFFLYFLNHSPAIFGSRQKNFRLSRIS